MNPSTTSEGVPTGIRYRVLGMLCGLSMITYFDRVCFASAASGMAGDLGLASKEQLRWAHTAFVIAYGAFEIPAGWLGDRWGPRGTLLRIVIWWSLFTAITGLVGLKWGTVTLGGMSVLVLVRFLFGAGEAGAYPNIARAIHNWFPVAQWEMAQGLIWMSGRIAGGITPLVWAILVSGTSWSPPLVPWRGAFFIFGAFGAVWCLVFSRSFRDRPADHPSANLAEQQLIGSHWTPHSHSHVPVRAMLRSPSLWAICLMYSLLNYGWYFNVSYLAGYLKDRFQLKEGDLVGAIYTGAPLWIGAMGCLAGGMIVNGLTKLCGTRGRARQVLGVGAMLLCASAWWGVHRADSIHSFCLLISLAAFSIDITLGATWATCQDMGRRHAAVTAAAMNTVGTMGAALAAWLTGSIVTWRLDSEAARLGRALTAAEKLSTTLAGYQSVFATYAGVYLVAALCWCVIRGQPFEGAEETPSGGPDMTS